MLYGYTQCSNYYIFQTQSSVQTQITGEYNGDNDYSSSPSSSPVFWVHL